MLREIKMKVCGMRDRSNILQVLDLQPDFMGFIFYRGTPRFVGDDFAIPPASFGSTKRVGVFVNETTEQIMKTARNFQLDYVQLHGGETVSQCAELKDYGVGVIKVFSVDDKMNFNTTNEYKTVADYFLFDTKGKYFGGNAARFHWEILSRYDQQVPFLLSGGISPQHVEEIKMLDGLNLMAIDVNSGVEISPAFKDVNKIKEIKAKLHAKQ
jgi:phosphoribosylanthranilate isomerase